MSAVAASGDLVLERGEGVHVWDEAGRRYLDATGGLWYCNVGYGRDAIVEAATAPQRRLAARAASARGPAGLAERIAGIARMGDAVVFFASGGGESVETAVKLARRYWSL